MKIQMFLSMPFIISSLSLMGRESCLRHLAHLNKRLMDIHALPDFLFLLLQNDSYFPMPFIGSFISISFLLSLLSLSPHELNLLLFERPGSTEWQVGGRLLFKAVVWFRSFHLWILGRFFHMPREDYWDIDDCTDTCSVNFLILQL